MSRIITILVCFCLFGVLSLPVVAQEPPPDYSIQGTVDYAGETGAQIVYTVFNHGGPATESTQIELINLSGGIVLARRELRPLGDSGDSEQGTIPFPPPQFTGDFTPGETVNVYLVVDGPGIIEEPGSGTTTNNTSRAIQVVVPGQPESQRPQPTTPQPEDDTGDSFFDRLSADIKDAFDNIIDTDDSTQSMITAGIIASGTIIFLLVWVLVRILFRRSPAFGTWQPPYATMPPLDPNSTYGRRQSWQQHAHNNALTIPCQQGTIEARKVLLGVDGRYLSGWRILAARLTQFDMYGRVSRSEVLASNRDIKRLNKAVRKSGATQHDAAIARRVRPVAKSLAKQIKKRLSRRSAMLPMALDVRFRGIHGEIRIMFELYECQNGHPHLLDRWEPEMTVMGKTIYESYTYTIHGQIGGEKYKAFRRRLAKDLELALVDLCRTVSATPPQPPEPESQPQPRQPEPELQPPQRAPLQASSLKPAPSATPPPAPEPPPEPRTPASTLPPILPDDLPGVEETLQSGSKDADSDTVPGPD
jgi:hypothetical protein